MSIEDLLRDRVLLAKIMWIGLIFSMVLMAIGLYVIAMDIFG